MDIAKSVMESAPQDMLVLKTTNFCQNIHLPQKRVNIICLFISGQQQLNLLKQSLCPQVELCKQGLAPVGLSY